MSKNQLKKMSKCVRAMAIPSRVIKNAKGEVIKQLYNIFSIY